jgi:hypothetical protein
MRMWMAAVARPTTILMEMDVPNYLDDDDEAMASDDRRGFER